MHILVLLRMQEKLYTKLRRSIHIYINQHTYQDIQQLLTSAIRFSDNPAFGRHLPLLYGLSWKFLVQLTPLVGLYGILVHTIFLENRRMSIWLRQGQRRGRRGEVYLTAQYRTLRHTKPFKCRVFNPCIITYPWSSKYLLISIFISNCPGRLDS